MGMYMLVLLTAAAAVLIAYSNWWAASYANKWIGRIALALSTVPLLIFLVYAGALVVLALKTEDPKYAFVDMGFAVVLTITLVFVPIVYTGFRAGRRQRSSREVG